MSSSSSEKKKALLFCALLTTTTTTQLVEQQHLPRKSLLTRKSETSYNNSATTMTKTAPPRPGMMQTTTTIEEKELRDPGTLSPSSRCSDHGTFKFNCSKPSKEDPEQPCGKGCCTHRNPNNNSVFMKRRACKECKKLGEGGDDLCDLHFVDKRSCKKCATEGAKNTGK